MQYTKIVLNYQYLFIHTGWHSKKGESGEYGEKKEHGKKGGDKKYKKWGHKKGHWNGETLFFASAIAAVVMIGIIMGCLSCACDNCLLE